ncbi:MAG: nucleolar RNA-binding Nop10p family protein [Candidatus Nanohaloarchaea archaeon]
MIRRCHNCGSYTLKKEHCNSSTSEARPPKFSFPDHYGDYRRKTKREAEE